MNHHNDLSPPPADSREASSRLAGLALGLTLVLPTFAACRGTTDSPAHSASAILRHRPELALGRTDEFDYDPPAAGSYSLPVIQKAGDGDVVGVTGRDERLADVLRGSISVVSFIYTRCSDPSACPRASGMLRALHELSQADPILAENLRLVTLSFDPEHDTPDVMGTYGSIVQTKGVGADWLFLTTRSSRELEPILQQYGQLVERKKDAADKYGPLSHTIRVYLIDRKGQVRNIYSFGLLDPRMVVTDVRTLLLEELKADSTEGRQAS